MDAGRAANLVKGEKVIEKFESVNFSVDGGVEVVSCSTSQITRGFRSLFEIDLFFASKKYRAW